MCENKILTEEEYYTAQIGRDWFPSYKEYLKIEQRKTLLDAMEILKEWNSKPFYPGKNFSFTEVINGFSGNQLNKINEIIEKFQKRIKEWDFREEK